MRTSVVRAVLFAAIVLSPSLAAQQVDTLPRDSVATLPTIEVVGSILPPGGPGVGSGVPARTSTITNEELETWEPRLISDFIATQPGFSLYDDLGSPFKTSISTRGFYASPVVGLPQGVSVFLDGVPVNEPDAAQVNFDLLPLEHIRRVELLSGTASLLGPNSLGGSINLLTNHGGGPTRGELEVSGGSYEALSAEGSVAGSSRGWNFYAGGGYAREDGWRQVTGAEGYNGFANVGRSGGRSGFNLQVLGAKSRAETAGSLPLSIFEVQPDSNLSAQDFEDLEQLHFALSGYTGVGAGTGSARVYYRGNDAERFNVNQINDPDVRALAENRTLGGAADWRYDAPVGNGRLSLRLGAGGSANDVRVQLFAERIDPGQTTDVQSDIWDLNAYTTADYSVGRVTLSGGLRYDYVRVPFNNLLDPTRDTTSSYSRLSPKGGLSLDVGSGVSLFGSAGASFRAPAVIELACADPEEPCPLPFALGDDPPLDPVTATTLEFGTRYLGNSFALDGAVYRTWVRDDIFLFPFEEEGEPEGSTIDGFFANLGDTRREGVELGGRYFFRQGHSLYANYAYTRATFQVDGVEIFSIREEGGGENEVQSGDRFPLIPDHRVSGGALFQLPAGLSFGVDARYVGEQYLRGDEANEEEPLDSYFTADVRLGWEVGPWEVAGIVTNLFDSDHATFGTFNINQTTDEVEPFLAPAQPRQFRVILRRGFGG
ncbi:MAG: TonB-dependent receptor [Gemmatimonadales bacterium]|nr:TonB-dependent receptor [Gemmatimonadales bacterium]